MEPCLLDSMSSIGVLVAVAREVNLDATQNKHNCVEPGGLFDSGGGLLPNQIDY